MAFAVSTHVVLAHGGYTRLVRENPWQVPAFAALFLAALIFRVLVDFDRDRAEARADALTDAATARLHGRFAKLGAGYTRSQPIGKRGDLVVKLSGQAASTNLDSSETFLLGGMGAVRAYPAGETAGDQSAIAQFEYHLRLRDGLRAFAFYDHGWIEQHRNPWPGLKGRNEVQLKGAGAGLAWNPGPRVELSLIGAAKVGRNPLADPLTGTDSDGRSRRYRLWSFATVRF